MNAETVSYIVEIVLAVVGIVLARFIIPWVKKNTENTKLAEILEWVESAVLCAEQTMTAETGEQKKAYVVAFIEAQAQSIGIKLTSEEIDALIESAVKAMNMTEKETA